VQAFSRLSQIGREKKKRRGGGGQARDPRKAKAKKGKRGEVTSAATNVQVPMCCKQQYTPRRRRKKNRSRIPRPKGRKKKKKEKKGSMPKQTAVRQPTVEGKEKKGGEAATGRQKKKKEGRPIVETNFRKARAGDAGKKGGGKGGGREHDGPTPCEGGRGAGQILAIENRTKRKKEMFARSAGELK